VDTKMSMKKKKKVVKKTKEKKGRGY
jgi:hypothetical protein